MHTKKNPQIYKKNEGDRIMSDMICINCIFNLSLKVFSVLKLMKDYIFEIFLVGTQGVGKSSLFLRFCDNNFI